MIFYALLMGELFIIHQDKTIYAFRKFLYASPCIPSKMIALFAFSSSRQNCNHNNGNIIEILQSLSNIRSSATARTPSCSNRKKRKRCATLFSSFTIWRALFYSLSENFFQFFVIWFYYFFCVLWIISEPTCYILAESLGGAINEP